MYAKTEHKRDKYKMEPILNFVIFPIKENFDSKMLLEIKILFQKESKRSH